MTILEKLEFAIEHNLNPDKDVIKEAAQMLRFIHDIAINPAYDDAMSLFYIKRELDK